MPNIYVSDIYTMDDVCRNILSQVFGNNPGFRGTIYYMTNNRTHFTVIISHSRYVLACGYYPNNNLYIIVDCCDRSRFYSEIKMLMR